MLNLIKKLFQKEKPVTIEDVPIKKLNEWFNNKVSKIGLNDYLQEYFTKVQNIKVQLKEKLEILTKQEMSEKEQKQVEDRVKNIVIGHKQHYVREMERFTEYLTPIEKTWKTIKEYQEAIQFNKELDTEIDNLAKRTHKSYQATQHLFFDTVQNVFKSMGELNILVKDFKKTITKYNIENLTEIQQLIVTLHKEIEKKNDLKQKIDEKKEQSVKITHAIKKLQKKEKGLTESEKYKEYQKLKEKRAKIEEEYEEIRNQVFLFFSKLQKPLRKYEYIALEKENIKPYIEDSINAFWNDTELNIVHVLQGLKNNVDKLHLDEKQQKNVTSLILKSEDGYLKELAEKGKKAMEERQSLENEISNNVTIKKIEEMKQNINKTKHLLDTVNEDLDTFSSKLERINIENIKKNISKKINESFNIFLEIQTESPAG